MACKVPESSKEMEVDHTKSIQGSILPSKRVEEPSYFKRLRASFMATVFGITFTSPLDVLKTRLQIQMDKGVSSIKYTSILNSFKTIWREEGIKGMFRGYKATVICTPIFHSIYFPIYERLRIKFANELELDKSNPKVVLMSVAGASSFSNLVTNPLWMIRVRMQAEIFRSQHQKNYERKYKGLFTSIYRVYRTEGFLALYTGFLASTLGICHCCVYFPTYEWTKVQFKQMFEKDKEKLSSKFI